MEKKKGREIEDAHNLMNIDEDLYKLIDRYNINQQYLAKEVFKVEWQRAQAEPDKDKKLKEEKRIAGKLRNKLLGFGNLSDDEYKKIQNVMYDIAKDMMRTVEASFSKRAIRRKEKIKGILDGLDEDERKELLKNL